LSGVTLTTIRVRSRVTAQELPIHWRTLTGVPTSAAGEIVYDARASFPVEYLDLDFVDAADAVDVAVLSRRTPSAEWIVRHTGLFYALEEAGGALRSAPARIGTDADRYWSIRKNGSGGWTTGRAPRLKIGWHPHELVFVAKGSPPYMLAYGSARVPAADAPVGALLASLDEAARTRQVREATVGPPRDLGGVTALAAPRDTRRIVLWTVLALAVAVLAWIAIRTFRDTMRHDGVRP
jgi:hypothetical protein